MTDRSHGDTPATPGVLHLDDEALSAVLDGEGAPEESAHVDACGACGARMSALRDASLLVRTPVEPVDDALRERAIEAAVAVATSSNVVPMRRRPFPRWLGAAAAAAVAVAAVGLVVRTGDDRRGTDDTAAGVDDASEPTTATDETATALAAAPPPIEGGDLGAIEDRDLRAVIGSAVARRASGGTTGVAESGAGEEAPASDDAASATGTAAGPACEEVVRAGNPDLGPLVYRATGTWDDQPAEVLAFEVAGDRWVYVLDLDDCAIRNQQTHAG